MCKIHVYKIHTKEKEFAKYMGSWKFLLNYIRCENEGRTLGEKTKGKERGIRTMRKERRRDRRDRGRESDVGKQAAGKAKVGKD